MVTREELLERVTLAVNVIAGLHDADYETYRALGGDWDDDGMGWDGIDWEREVRKQAAIVLSTALIEVLAEKLK